MSGTGSLLDGGSWLDKGQSRLSASRHAPWRTACGKLTESLQYSHIHKNLGMPDRIMVLQNE